MRIYNVFNDKLKQKRIKRDKITDAIVSYYVIIAAMFLAITLIIIN